MDLRNPPLDVWAGEVVLLAAPDTGDLRAVLDAARAKCARTLRVAEPTAAYAVSCHADVLAAGALRGAAVLAGVSVDTGPVGRCALGALRMRVARRVPCRIAWLIGGRVYAG